MRKLIGLFVAALTLAAALCASQSADAQVSFGRSRLFNDGWKFVLTDIPEAAEPSFDDSRWRPTPLPHDWSIQGPLSPDNASCTGYLPGGIGWYRKHFSGSEIEESHAFIHFEGVYNRSSVYLNGHLLGTRPSGFNSFTYELTPFLDRDGDNVLSVRVDHSRAADSRWYTGSGINRDVWLIQSGDVRFAEWGLAYRAVSLSGTEAIVCVETAIEGLDCIPGKGEKSVGAQDSGTPGAKATGKKGTARYTLQVELLDANGTVVAKSSAKAATSQETTLKLSYPHRWSLDDCYLYTLRASIFAGKALVDQASVRAGLRTLEFDADTGFALNGVNMKVKGVCVHDDAGVLGSVVPKEVWRSRLLTLKSLGVNAIRMSHNPHAPLLYDLCDELGFLVIDEAFDEWEFPKNKWIKGWNVGIPGHEGTDDYFNEWCERDVKDMVRRDRNHPCIFLWSIGNEVDYPNDPYSHPILDGDGLEFTQPMAGGYKPDAPDAMRIGVIAKRFTEYVHSIDRSRPVTGALAGVVMSNQTGYPEAVDVVGYNYTESRYVKDHKTYPGRILYGSENRHDINAWKAVTDNDHIFGQFLWTGIDYLGEAGAWPSRGSSAGLIDLAGNVKPRGYFRASLWSEAPVCYIGTYPQFRQGNGRGRAGTDASDVWNYEKGQTVRVVCYTNAASAHLLLNGIVVGSMATRNEDSGIISWDVPYAPGTLKAEAFDEGGQKVSEYEIRTFGRPYSIRAVADKSELKQGELVQIAIDILDENGNTVKFADNEITCQVSAPGILLGLESADMRDTGIWTDNVQRVYKGRLKAYIKAFGDTGTVRISLTSPLLQPALLEIPVE